MTIQETSKPNNLFKFFTGMLILIFFRLIYLQVHQTDDYLLQSKKNFLRENSITSPRGNILDANGTFLVTNRPVINLYWAGTKKKYTHDMIQAILDELTPILQDKLLIDDMTVKKIARAHRFKKRELLATDISSEQLSKIKELFADTDTIAIDTDFERFYPHCAYASHILGYLSRLETEQVGTMGLEKICEQTLKGYHGTILKTINSTGTPLTQIEIKSALSGDDIHTTIDVSLQNITEKIFPENHTGTIIVMDPDSGSIRALVSRPDFDPNIFLKPILTSDWKALQENKPFLNRAFSALYPPGSIFKLISVSAALENNLITPEDTFNCDGFYYFGKRKYWCHKRYGHGDITTKQALEQSCNILFFEIGKQIDIDVLADYAHRFGLGEKTNIIFSEKSGLIPTHAWKQMYHGEPWWQGETLSVAIGQSFLLVTPIQIARMISSIFTGSLVNPRIIADEPIVHTPLDIKPETLDFLQKSMRSVVTHGTGKRINQIDGMEIYGKTSTAQTSNFNKRNKGNEFREHGWFVGYIKFKEEKPLTLVILLEHVGSARFATTTAKNFLQEYKKIINQTA